MKENSPYRARALMREEMTRDPERNIVTAQLVPLVTGLRRDDATISHLSSSYHSSTKRLDKIGANVSGF